MQPRARTRAAFAATILLTTMVIWVTPVAAAAQSQTVDRTVVTGTIDMGSKSYSVPGGTIDISATAVLSQPIRETVSYDDANIRQGRSMDVTRTVATNGAGSFKVVWTGSGLFGPFTRTATVPCTIGFTSAVVVCNATSASIRLLGSIPIPLTPIIDVELQASVSVAQGFAAQPSITTVTLSGGVPGLTRQAPMPGTQAYAVPCSAAIGDTLAVDETDFEYAIDVTSTNGPAILVGTWIPIPLPPFIVESPFVTSTPTPADAFVTQALRDATSHVVTLGIIKANNVPPVADSGPSPYSGNEGSSIQFDGSASSALCGPPTLRWDFSDGGVAFGAKPFHTFTDNGTFSGQLTVSDTTGLSSSTNFSIDVANVAPTVSAGPDTTAAWGRPVQFNGSATDPGSADQATLTFTWEFGDGSPSASGGPSVIHSYTTPGVYDATLTVTDKDGGFASDTRKVNVRKRNVSVGYLGDTAGTYDTKGSLSGSLVDEFGSPVNGRTLTFSVFGSPSGSGVTNSSGIAITAYTPLLDATTYATMATFNGSGDALYATGSGSGSIAIARKASQVTYTGALKGGPNKTVSLSATLVDATGKLLAGRTIAFRLGSQSTTATTDANGVASTILKLAQKNGQYALTATWTPPGPDDAVHYTGSAASTTFSLQAR